MVDYDEIINWDALFAQSGAFQNNKPYRYAFVKGIFKPDFYNKLYDSFPKFDDTWFVNNDYRRSAKTKYFYDEEEGEPKEDSSLSQEWNKFKKFINTQEFLDNFSKFTGRQYQKTIRAGFFGNTKGDFQLPHIDEEGEFTNNLQIMFYFSKGWREGDPGGTYLCETDDEDTVFFEPYDLDNTMVCFEEVPYAWHGTRYITKENAIRQACSASIL